MDISEKYKIFFTNDCKEEMDCIYNYISKKLYAPDSAKKLMIKVQNTIQNLQYMPKVYRKIKKEKSIEMEYRRIVVNNYVILYTVSEGEKIIYIVHMYYGGSDYFRKI